MHIAVVLGEHVLASAIDDPLPRRHVYGPRAVRRLARTLTSRGNERYADIKQCLFGCRQGWSEATGLVHLYHRAGHDVSLIGLPMYAEHLPATDAMLRLDSFDLVNAQFVHLPVRTMRALLAGGVPVVGAMPPDIDNKQVQSLLLAIKRRRFAPTRVLIPARSDLRLVRYIAKNLPWRGDYVLIKGFHGLMGMFERSNLRYKIVRRADLADLIAGIVAETDILNNGIIVEPFIVSQKPRKGPFRQFLFKANFAAQPATRAGAPALTSRLVGRACSKRLGLFDLRGIEVRRAAPLNEPREIEGRVICNIERLKGLSDVEAGVATLDQFAGICTVDFIVDHRGAPYFLELNKHSSTAAERYDPDRPSAADLCAELHLIPNLRTRLTNALADFEATLTMCYRQGFLSNVVACDANGVTIVEP